jgi:hypothetical protein
MASIKQAGSRCSRDAIRHNPAFGIAAKIMWCEFVDSGTRGRGADNLPQHLVVVMPVPQTRPVLLIERKSAPSAI